MTQTRPGRVGFALAPALLFALGLSACTGQGGPDRIQSNPVRLDVLPLTIASPSRDRSVIYGGRDDPQLTYSAGFMKRVGLGTISASSTLSWAPDSRSFYVNDSGNAEGSELRLWRIGGRRAIAESPVVRHAAIQQLALRNRCASPDRMEYTTTALGWGEGGRTLYVLTGWHRQVNCPPETRVEAVVSRIDVLTGKVEQTLPTDDARLAWPGLPLAESELTSTAQSDAAP